MTTEEASQAELDDNGLPGPGAPTPLSALEVGYQCSCAASTLQLRQY